MRVRALSGAWNVVQRPCPNLGGISILTVDGRNPQLAFVFAGESEPRDSQVQCLQNGRVTSRVRSGAPEFACVQP